MISSIEDKLSSMLSYSLFKINGQDNQIQHLHDHFFLKILNYMMKCMISTEIIKVLFSTFATVKIPFIEIDPFSTINLLFLLNFFQNDIPNYFQVLKYHYISCSINMTINKVATDFVTYLKRFFQINIFIF